MGFIMDAIEDVGDFISDTVEAVIDNPLGALVSVGGMALGIPPIYAGALGGAANAAANDGNILEGALLGGATGYVGGLAGNAAAQAGANATLAGAAGGAAAGATGAALTGNNILEGAFTGGVLGGATGYVKSEFFSPDSQTYTRTYDDGSTIEFTKAGNIISNTPATDGSLAPVFDYSETLGKIVPAATGPQFGTNPLNELSIEETNDLIRRNVSPGMIDNLVDTGDQPFRVEIEGAAGTADAPQYAKTEFRTPGTDLASWDQVDAGQATWNPAANAWEVVTPNYDTFQPTDTNFGAFGEAPTGGQPVTQPVDTTPTTYTFDDGSTITIGANGQTSITDAISGNTVTTKTGSSYISEGGGKTTVFDDGSWMTINPDGSSVVADSTGKVTTHGGGTVTGPGTGGTPTDLGEIEIVDTRPTTTTPTTTTPTDLGTIDIVGTRPVVTTPVDTTPIDTTPVDTTIPYNPVTPVTPVTPIFPVITPTTPTTPVTPTTPTTPVNPANIARVNPMSGLNPGFMNPTPFYNTTSPVQSQFSWGARAFQPGPTFDSKLYNQAPAPETPWGIQNIAQPLTAQEYTRAYQGQPIVRPPLPVARRYEAPVQQVAGPVAPV